MTRSANRLAHDTHIPGFNLNDTAIAIEQEEFAPHSVTAIKMDIQIPDIDLEDPTTGDSLAVLAHHIATDEQLSQISPEMLLLKQQPSSHLSHTMRFQPYEYQTDRCINSRMMRPASRICEELAQARVAHAENCTLLFILLVDFNDLKSQMTETEWNEGAWKPIAWEIKDMKRKIDLFHMTVHDLKRELGVELSDDEEMDEEAREVLLAHLAQQREDEARERNKVQRVGVSCS